MKNIKIIKIAIISVVTALAVALLSLITYSYFASRIRLYTDDGQTKYFRMGMELNTFFDIINSDSEQSAIATGTSLGIVCSDISVTTEDSTLTTTTGSDGKIYYTFNPDAKWGSASNPYIISKTNHFQNLYVLQNCGYFSDITGLETSLKENDMPYFLVCTSSGKPVTIDGTDKGFECIGNEKYPFIGFLGGAFIDGTTKVNNQSSDQSVIYNITACSSEDVVDMGLFGRIGYLGNADNKDSEGHITGSVSTVRDLLLYDVKVKVEEKTKWTAIIDKVAHLFSFSRADQTIIDDIPHENHHIGILAGHVELATVEYISVYYSSDTVKALDVSMKTASNNGVSANFKSISGILGYVYEMNSSQTDGTITIGGINNEDIEVSGSGVGTGGGLLSGTGRGYVAASTIYNNYYVEYPTNESGVAGTRDNVTVSDRIGQEVWEFQKIDSTNTEYGIMLDYDGVNYTLHGHSAIIATMSGGIATVKGNQWSTYIICDVSAGGKTYRAYDGKSLSSFKMTNLNIRHSISLKDNTELCTEYIRNRILWGTSQTGMYYFYDGVFTFSLSNVNDTIVDTWKNDTPDSLTVGVNDDSKWTKDVSGTPNSVVTFIKPVVTEDDLRSGKKLFIAYKDDAGKYHLVTLNGNSTYTPFGGNDATTTAQTEVSLVSDETKATLKSALDENILTLDEGSSVSIDTIKSEWNDLQILDIGNSADGYTLAQLREMYQIEASWSAIDPDSNTYEDDGTTHVTGVGTLSENARNAVNTYYTIDSTTPVQSNGTQQYFSLKENPQVASVDSLNNYISGLTTTLFDDTWNNQINDQIRSKIALSTTNDSITQTEMKTYNNGFFCFKTSDVVGTSWYYDLYYYYPDGSVSERLVHKKKESVKKWETILSGIFSSYSNSTDIDGNKTYFVTYSGTVNGQKISAQLPLLYYQNKNSKFYRNFDRNSSDQDAIRGSNVVTVANGAFGLKYDATYSYILATETGNGTVYTWCGTNKTCSNVSKTSKNMSSINGWGLYYVDANNNIIILDYSLYSCTVDGATKTAIMFTRYRLDGVMAQTLTGSGVTHTLLNNSIVLDGNYQGIGRVFNIDGINYEIYRCNQKIGFRVANIGLNGVFNAYITNSGVNYRLNASTTLNEPSMLNDASGKPVTISLSNGSSTKAYRMYTSDGKLGIMLIENQQTGGHYTFWHGNGTSSDTYRLRLLRSSYIATYYNIMVSTDAYANNPENFKDLTTPTVTNSDKATVTLNGDGTAYIAYTVNGTTRYLHYDTTNNRFNTANNTSSSDTRLYLFTVEALHDSVQGLDVLPLAGTTVGKYSADNYILMPNSTLKGEETANVTSDNPVYGLKSLADLYNEGWRNGDGLSLAKNDLYKKFSLRDEITWGLTLNVFNGSWNFGSGSLANGTSIVAPIGSDGSEANIPKGCIAFKINNANMESYKIRTIVAIPVSEVYPGHSQYQLETDEDYYFGIWQTESAGTSTIQSFEKSNALEKFELPRSHRNNQETAISDCDHILVTINGETYRAYLQGNQILVGYTFEVSDPGVYVLGATNGPMEIVYFSADGTADTGKDGVTSYKMGTIDFVYDNGAGGVKGDRIITIKDRDTVSDGSVDYGSMYYPSLCILYTDNSNGVTPILQGDTDITGGFANINDFGISIRRIRSGTTSLIVWKAYGGNNSNISSGVADAAYIQMSRYALTSDEVQRYDDGYR